MPPARPQQQKWVELSHSWQAWDILCLDVLGWLAEWHIAVGDVSYSSMGRGGGFSPECGAEAPVSRPPPHSRTQTLLMSKKTESCPSPAWMNGYGHSGPLSVGTDDRRGQKDYRVAGSLSLLLLVTSLSFSLAVNHELSAVRSILTLLAALPFFFSLHVESCLPPVPSISHTSPSLSLDIWLWAIYSTATQDNPLRNRSSSRPLPAVHSPPPRSLSVRPYLPPSWPHHRLPLSLSRTCSTSFRPAYHFISLPFQLPIITLMDRASDRQRGREEGNEGSTFCLHLCLYLFLSFTSVAETLTASVELNKLMGLPAVLKGRCEFIKQQ